MISASALTEEVCCVLIKVMKSFQAFFAFLLVFLLAPSIYAQETNSASKPAESSGSMAAPSDLSILPPRQDNQGFLGQDHSYSVVFRGNGEAVVSLRVVLSNKGETPLSQVSLRVPKVQPNNVSVYQVIRDRVCSRYNQPVIDPLTRIYPTGPQTCAEYQDPDYFNYYYGTAKYQKAEVNYSGDTINVTLPVPIEPNKSGSYFVYYRASGYANKNILGGYGYMFESLKVDDDIRNLQVGISSDSDLILKGATGEVEYRFNESAADSLSKVSAGAPAANTAIDQFYNQIGQGRIIKTASSLAPLESYSVSGAFAKNTFALYAKEILIGLGVFLAVVMISILVGRFVMRSLAARDVVSKKDSTTAKSKSMLFVVAGISFISALMMLGYTGLLIVLFEFLSSSYYQFQMLAGLFLIIISFCIYALLLFLPGVVLGFKRGLEWGVATVIGTVVCMVLLGGIAIFVLFLFAGNSGPEVYPLLRTM